MSTAVASNTASSTDEFFEENECPLCMEEIDFSDKHFKPCPCGYRICRFCWNHIKENLNKRCPACRREYSEKDVEYRPPTQAELQRYRAEKKQREKEKKEMEANNRKHLANMRVVQKNLVYVIGLSARVANEELLKQWEYFGQYGKILKIVVNRKNLVPVSSMTGGQSKVELTVGVYVTYSRKEDAAACIKSIDGTVHEGRVLRASYGTTKYCTFFLRGLVCQNPGCMYLHEPGEEADSYTKEEMAAGKHHAKIHPQSMPQFSATGAHGNSVSLNELGFAVGPITPFGANAPERTEDQRAIDRRAEDETSSGIYNAPNAGPSILPRKATWAKTVDPTKQIKDQTLPGIECSLFYDICPLMSSDHTRRSSLLKSGDHSSSSTKDGLHKTHTSSSQSLSSSDLVNTASLHRYMFLAQQAREYYAQIVSSSARTGSVGVSGSDPVIPIEFLENS